MGICSLGTAGAAPGQRPARGGMVATFKIAVLGAQGVGKSAIVRQFLYNEFSEVCVPTTARRVYLPAVVMNGHVHDLQIMDFPPITAFPVNTLQVGAHPAPCDGTPMLGGVSGDLSGVSLYNPVGPSSSSSGDASSSMLGFAC